MLKTTNLFSLLLIGVFALSSAFASQDCSEDFWNEATSDQLLDYEIDEETLNTVSCNDRGDTIFHLAARYTQDPSVIEMLITHGADANSINEDGETVLAYAADNDNQEVYQIILEAVENSDEHIRSIDADTDTDFTDSDEDEDRGWYLGMQSGVALPIQNLNVDFFSPDTPTNCDVFLVGDRADTTDCSIADSWMDAFKPGKGLLAEGSVGYGWKNWRVEGAFARRVQPGSLGDTSGYQDLTPGASKAAEFVESWQGMKNISSSSVWANLFYDFNKGLIGKTKIRPFVGAGIGVTSLSMDYSAAWHRNPRPEALIALGKIPEAAGTLSAIKSETLNDKSFTAQVIVGLDIPLSERVSIGAQARYSRLLNDFFQEVAEYDVLRSHQSKRTPNGESVGYTVGVPEFNNFDVTVNLKISLNKKKKKTQKK